MLDRAVLLGYLTACDVLLVDGFQYFATTHHRWLNKGLAASELQQSLALFEFLLVLLERLVNVFAVF